MEPYQYGLQFEKIDGPPNVRWNLGGRSAPVHMANLRVVKSLWSCFKTENAETASRLYKMHFGQPKSDSLMRTMTSASSSDSSPAVAASVVSKVLVKMDNKGRVRTSQDERRTILAEFERAGCLPHDLRSAPAWYQRCQSPLILWSACPRLPNSINSVKNPSPLPPVPVHSCSFVVKNRLKRYRPVFFLPTAAKVASYAKQPY